jgi:hypothetical protein
MSATRTRDPETYRSRKEAARQSRALTTLSTVPAEIDIEVPTPVTEIVRRYRGVAPKLPAEAFELARQVYFLQHGTMADCARAIIAAGLGDSTDETIVRERLQTWWQRERWPKRPIGQTVALRDAAADGGLYRGRICKGIATGSGPAPKGSPCGQSALDDSDYCPHHDPRPEYRAMREQTGHRLAAARAAEFVPVEPFGRWLRDLRDRLVSEQAAAGKALHHNSEGWHLVASELELDVSQLGRWAQGGKKRGKPITQIRAKSVVDYAGKVGVSFEEIYGFEAPTLGAIYVCPGCGGHKNSGSKLCRTCFEAENYGTQCAYVNGKGEQCPVTTRHESGYCCKCRRIVFRERKPRTGKPGFLNDAILVFAVDEYRHSATVAAAARRLWDCNVGGVADHYKAPKNLTGQLVRIFRRRGWRSRADAETAYWLMIAEHGEPRWPDEVGRMVAA